MARAGRPNPQKALERHVRRMAWPPGQRSRRGHVYDGPAGFVLEHGEWFEPVQLPATMVPGLPGRCYANSIHDAVMHGLDYCEGWAIDRDMRLACHHAWVAEPGGTQALDSTWTGLAALVGNTLYYGAPGGAYYGCRFSYRRADDCTWHGDASVLDDFLRGWPLLLERWVGEPAEPELRWPEPSPALQALLAAKSGDKAAAAAWMERAYAEMARADE